MEKEQAKIITVLPTVMGNGGKYTAVHIADGYKKAHPTSKVALVDFDTMHPYLGGVFATADEIHGMDALITQIDGGLLKEAVFMENMVKLPSDVHLLKGSSMASQYGYLKDDHIQTMMDYLHQLYDVVVIAVSPVFSSIATIYGLQEATDIVLVVRNNYANQQQILGVIRELDRYKQTDHVVAVHNFYTGAVKEGIVSALTGGNVQIVGALTYEAGSIDHENMAKGTVSSSGWLRSKKKNNQEVIKELVTELTK